MEMKIYSLGLFVLMLICFWGLFSLNKDQGKFYKILLCSVGLVYLLLFLNDFPRIFLDKTNSPIFLNKTDSLISQYLLETLFPWVIVLSPFIQLFLFLKFYPHRWIHSVLYWILCVRFIGYPYEPNFGEINILPYLVGGFALAFYLWITLFVYRKNIVCKILFILTTLCLLFVFAKLIWELMPVSAYLAEIPALKAFWNDFSPYYNSFQGIIAYLFGLLGAPIFYVAFYAGEFALCLAVWGILKDKNRNQIQEISQETDQAQEISQETDQAQEISQAKETNQLKEA